MDYIELDIKGWGKLTSAPTNADPYASLRDIPSVPAAKFSITKVVPSDQAVMFNIAASPASIPLLRLDHAIPPAYTHYGPLAPSTSADTLYLDSVPPHGETLWVGSEKMAVAIPGALDDPKESPCASVSPSVVLRGYGSTSLSLIASPDRNPSDGVSGDGRRPVGVPVYRNRPHSLRGLRATYTLYVQGRAPKLLLDGNIRSLTDSGDSFQLELSSTLKELEGMEWPIIRALWPYGAKALEALGPPAFPEVEIASPYLIGTLGGSTNPGGFGQAPGPLDNFTSGMRYRSAGGNWLNFARASDPAALFSTGHVARNVHYGYPGAARDYLTNEVYAAQQPYYRSMIYPDAPESWVMVAWQGSGGYIYQPTSSFSRPPGVDCSPDTYMLLRVKLIQDLRQATPTAAAYRSYGVCGYNIEGTGAHQAHGSRALYFAPKDPTADEVRRHVFRSLKDSERRTAPDTLPAVFKGGGIFKVPTVSTTWAPTHFHAQLGILDQEVIEGPPLWGPQFNVYTNFLPKIDRVAAQDVLYRLATRLTDPGDSAAFPGVSRAAIWRAASSMLVGAGFDHGGSPVSAWPPEQWYGRKIRDTLFKDMFAQLAIVWVLGPAGLRPIWLADKVLREDPSLTVIDTSNVRDRDHTVKLDFDLPIEKVVFPKLRGGYTADNSDWWETSGGRYLPSVVPGPDSLTVVSSLADSASFTGETITHAASPYLSRDMEFSFEGARGVTPAQLLERCWSEAVKNYGRITPTCVLRVDMFAEGLEPGDLCDISLPNFPSPWGGPQLGVQNLRAQVLERGLRVEDGTAELLLLLVGWSGYGGPPD